MILSEKVMIGAFVRDHICISEKDLILLIYDSNLWSLVLIYKCVLIRQASMLTSKPNA